MNLIVESLSTIVNGFQFIIQFITFAANEVATVIKTCLTISANVLSFMQWLPYSVRAIFGVCFTVIVIYKIVGREG